MATYTVDVRSQGPITLPNTARAFLEQDQLKIYPIPWEAWYVWDSGARLPNTSASDDLGFYQGTFAIASPSIRTFDVKTLTTTLYARTSLYLPAEYDAAETVQIRFFAGMITTIASSTATIDAQLYESDGQSGIGADLVTTNPITINSLTFANKDFSVTSTNLAAGDVLDLRVAIAVTDVATGTAVIGSFGLAALLLDVKG